MNMTPNCNCFSRKFRFPFCSLQSLLGRQLQLYQLQLSILYRKVLTQKLSGIALYVYMVNKSMTPHRKSFCNNDGDFLLCAQEGNLVSSFLSTQYLHLLLFPTVQNQNQSQNQTLPSPSQNFSCSLNPQYPLTHPGHPNRIRAPLPTTRRDHCPPARHPLLHRPRALHPPRTRLHNRSLGLQLGASGPRAHRRARARQPSRLPLPHRLHRLRAPSRLENCVQNERHISSHQSRSQPVRSSGLAWQRRAV